MADVSENCEFWLPPKFLTDDEDNNNATSFFAADFQQDLLSGFNLLGSNSDPVSPVESVLGSSETESDEDEYLTGLSRKMAHSTLEESRYEYEISKGRRFSGSPQSTLCGVCGCKKGSSSGTPNCSSLVSSPTGPNRNEGALDLLYAAAGEVARMSMMEDMARHYHRKNGIWVPSRKTRPDLFAPQNSNPSLGSFDYSYQQLQLAHLQRLKQKQIMKQEQVVLETCQNHHMRSRNGANNRPLNMPMSAWTTPEPGSGMRAVFLGNPAPKRECAGTGVFIPRRVGTEPETRKKPGCSTVLMPERVVQALNLNLKPIMDAQLQSQVQNRCNNGAGGFTTANGNGLKYGSTVPAVAQRMHNVRKPVAMSQELLLPQEWTY